MIRSAMPIQPSAIPHTPLFTNEEICVMRHDVSHFFYGDFKAAVQDVPLMDLWELWGDLQKEQGR